MLQEDPGQEWHGHNHLWATTLTLKLAISFLHKPYSFNEFGLVAKNSRR